MIALMTRYESRDDQTIVKNFSFFFLKHSNYDPYSCGAKLKGSLFLIFLSLFALQQSKTQPMEVIWAHPYEYCF